MRASERESESERGIERRWTEDSGRQFGLELILSPSLSLSLRLQGGRLFVT